MDTSSIQKKKQEQIYRTMFDYSLSTPWCQPTAPWSSERHKDRRQRILYPFLMECNYTAAVESNLKRKRTHF